MECWCRDPALLRLSTVAEFERDLTMIRSAHRIASAMALTVAGTRAALSYWPDNSLLPNKSIVCRKSR